MPRYLGQVALLGRAIVLQKGGELKLKVKSPTSVKWMELLMAVVTEKKVHAELRLSLNLNLFRSLKGTQGQEHPGGRS